MPRHRCAVKRSTNRIANWFFAARQVIAGIFQLFAMLRKASQISFVAASSFGKWLLTRSASKKTSGYIGSSGRFCHSTTSSRHLQAVQFGQMSLDLAHWQAARVQRDHLIVKARQVPLVLGDELRFKAAVAVAGMSRVSLVSTASTDFLLLPLRWLRAGSDELRCWSRWCVSSAWSILSASAFFSLPNKPASVNIDWGLFGSTPSSNLSSVV
jgi:hypothetical protein